MEGNPFDPFKGLSKAMESLQKGEVPNVAAVIEEVLTLPAFKEPAAIAQGYQMAGSWVLKPEGARKGVIHFLGKHSNSPSRDFGSLASGLIMRRSLFVVVQRCRAPVLRGDAPARKGLDRRLPTCSSSSEMLCAFQGGRSWGRRHKCRMDG
jgi:hypothetical protein